MPNNSIPRLLNGVEWSPTELELWQEIGELQNEPNQAQVDAETVEWLRKQQKKRDKK